MSEETTPFCFQGIGLRIFTEKKNKNNNKKTTAANGCVGGSGKVLPGGGEQEQKLSKNAAMSNKIHLYSPTHKKTYADHVPKTKAPLGKTRAGEGFIPPRAFDNTKFNT